MDFRIVIDTREQAPWDFDCPTVRRKLDAGDYSVDGLEGAVAVERKSLKDFVSTVFHSFKRFHREMERLATYEAACVVVEADLDAVLRGAEGEALRGMGPDALLGAALWLSLVHRVPIYWCGSRPAARQFTEQYLRMFVRTRHERSRL